FLIWKIAKATHGAKEFAEDGYSRPSRLRSLRGNGGNIPGVTESVYAQAGLAALNAICIPRVDLAPLNPAPIRLQRWGIPNPMLPTCLTSRSGCPDLGINRRA